LLLTTSDRDVLNFFFAFSVWGAFTSYLVRTETWLSFEPAGGDFRFILSLVILSGHEIILSFEPTDGGSLFSHENPRALSFASRSAVMALFPRYTSVNSRVSASILTRPTTG
jgi:hypothetical protein